MRQLAGRVAVVTGAASGMGQASRPTCASPSRDAVLARRFYILIHPDESFDMVEQQLRWMKTNVPLVPGPGVARDLDAGPRP